MSETVIKIENLHKQYRLGTLSHRTLYKDAQSWWAKARGKEDPNQTVDHATLKKIEQTENGRFWALKDISLEVKKGEVLGIIGKNGAGKSTLLKILSRVTTPTKGQIKVKGRIASLLEVGTGFHPELTGRENVYLNGAVLGMTKNEVAQKFDEIVEFADIREFIDTPVKRYSSGMYVRLAFAVAAHLEPEILVVDEVLAVGDAEFQKKCLGKMKDVAGEGRTVLFVSHNMTSVTSLCSSGILLNEGKIIYAGSAGEVVNRYLSQSINAGTEKIWDKNNCPGDEFVSVHSIRLIDQFHKGLSLAHINDKIGVEIKYEIKKEKHKPTVNISLWSSVGILVFLSIRDKDESLYKKGTYKSIAWIPPHILNTGIYNLRVVISTFIPFIVHFDQKEVVTIEVIEDKNNRKTEYNKQHWPGVVRPMLNWVTES